MQRLRQIASLLLERSSVECGTLLALKPLPVKSRSYLTRLGTATLLLLNNLFIYKVSYLEFHNSGKIG